MNKSSSNTRFKKGHIPWNKGKKTGLAPWLGKKRSLEDIEKIRVGHIGKKHSEETRRKMSLAKKGNTPANFAMLHTPEVRRKVSEKLKGANSYLWRGGITPLNLQIRNCREYRMWRDDVFERDDYTCVECGARGVYLEADHIEAFAAIMRKHDISDFESALICTDLWNVANGRTLCKKCHEQTDTYRNKSRVYTKKT